MQFYKAKWEASTPTKVQLNVPTNTDYMVGTELYVKGEKKDITAENVKLIEKEGEITLNALSGTSNEDFDYSLSVINNKPTNIWTTKKDITLVATAEIAPDEQHAQLVKNGTNLKVFNTAWNTYWYNNNALLQYMNFAVDGVTYTIRTVPNSLVLDYDPSITYWQIIGGGNLIKSIDIPAGTQISSVTYFDAGTETNKSRTGSFTVEQHFVDYITPDLDVNGIPAFSMKSGNEEADKFYTVNFSGSNTNVTWDTALSAYKPVEGDLFQYDTFASNKFKFTVLKEFTIKAPFAAVGSEYIDLGNNFTNIAARDKNGNSVFGGELGFAGNYLQLSSATDGVFNVFYLTSGDLATIGYKKSSNYVIGTGTGYAESVTLKPGDIIQINKNSGFSDQSPRFWYFQIGQDAYDYNFKLFINEDETSKGDINLNGTTPAEVSAIVDDAITNYDSQLSTVNLSGTFDDDSTFSYNFVIKN